MSQHDDEAAARTRLAALWADALRTGWCEGPGPDEVEAYVDGRLPGEERAAFEIRLADDVALQAEVRDLRELHSVLAAERRRLQRRQRLGAGLAAAAALAAAAVLWRGAGEGPREAHRPPGGAVEVVPRLTLQDGDRRVAVAADGAVSGLDRVGEPLRGRVAAALRRESLTPPAAVAGLRGAPGVLMGGAADRRRFGVLAPVGTRVRSDRPSFRWQPHPDARAYVVTVSDEGLELVARSGELRGVTEWTAPVALSRGRTYEWQVAALAGSGREIAPRPSEAPARFEVLGAAEAAALERDLAAAAGSPLARAVALAEAGLIDEAVAVLEDLAADNPGARVVDAWRTSLRRAR